MLCYHRASWWEHNFISVLFYVTFQKFGSKSDSQGDGNVAYVTDLGAWRSTDVPFTVDGLSSASLPVSGDLMGLNDTFWTNHVILTGWKARIRINTQICTRMRFEQTHMDSEIPCRGTYVHTLDHYNINNIHNLSNHRKNRLYWDKKKTTDRRECECENNWGRKRERGREYTYRAEVEALPSLQSPDLRTEQKRGGGIHF